MALKEEIAESRREKLRELLSLGLPALPNSFGTTRRATDIQRDFDVLEGSQVRVAGRVMRVRVMGKAAFAHIQDASGEIQLYFKRDLLGDELYRYFKLLDLGDIIGVEGTVFRTRTGETSIETRGLILLAKAYLPLPEKWHGLTDVEARYRQRYLDLISNPDSRRTFQIRSACLKAIRLFLDSRDFTEVETPILQTLYGGGAATPFTTHYESLDADVYLRIATELYLKRLIIGGFDRVYEIGKDFRNEGFSRKHSPEFTMIELYQAYADYRDIMTLTEELFSAVAQNILNINVLQYGDHAIDLTPPWRRITIQEAVQEFAGIDLVSLPTADALASVAQSRGMRLDQEASRGALIERIVSEFVEPNLVQPTFLCDFPIDFPGSLLAKRSKEDANIVERFELYIGAMEVANAFTELNDPDDQLRRMEALRGATEVDAHQIDRDFIVALEHGMPPTGGIGIGVDRFVMLLTNAHHIRETIFFPLLRQREATHAEP
ncbi:MAG: lysine--tRNA ligase [Chloroflexota bacterium]